MGADIYYFSRSSPEWKWTFIFFKAGFQNGNGLLLFLKAVAGMGKKSQESQNSSPKSAASLRIISRFRPFSILSSWFAAITAGKKYFPQNEGWVRPLPRPPAMIFSSSMDSDSSLGLLPVLNRHVVCCTSKRLILHTITWRSLATPRLNRVDRAERNKNYETRHNL